MEKAVKIAAISYINSTPFVYGLQHSDSSLRAELLLLTPSQCVNQMEQGKCDIAIVSVGALDSLSDVEIISDFCISATGEVRTVELLSNNNISEIKRIYLDGDSRTSVELIRILTDEYWNVTPDFININYTETIPDIKDGDGYLMIGDKVFGWENRFKYNYDLSKYWNLHTDMPFVFAVWVARKGVKSSILASFNEALRYGVANIDKVVDKVSKDFNIDRDTLNSYLTENIEFDLSDSKIKALELFLNKSHLLKSKEFSSHYR